MYKNLILIIFAYLLLNSLFAESYMMNCFNPDDKSTAFYKFIKNEKKLLSRPMKKKWTSFCDKNKNDVEIYCNFDELKITKVSVKEDSKSILKISYILNFKDYSLIEIKSLFIKLNNNDNEAKSTYKCRKINI